MSKNLIMSYPILKQGCADFLEGISYEVVANQSNKTVTIVHTLTGQSFVSKLLKYNKAQFSVLLLYRNGSERIHYACEATDVKFEGTKVVGKQEIEKKFSYAPEITPSIIILNDTVIPVADESSGLDEFWKHGGDIKIPKYSRIALSERLKFSSGGLSSLFKIEHETNFDQGIMDVKVNEHSNEGEIPVTLLCGQDVYDQLHKIPPVEFNTLPKSTSPPESLRLAIITNALCAMYTYMQQLHKSDNEYEESGALLDHLNMLEEKVGRNWQDENFTPILAATKMLPYLLDAKVINGEHDDE